MLQSPAQILLETANKLVAFLRQDDAFDLHVVAGQVLSICLEHGQCEEILNQAFSDQEASAKFPDHKSSSWLFEFETFMRRLQGHDESIRVRSWPIDVALDEKRLTGKAQGCLLMVGNVQCTLIRKQATELIILGLSVFQIRSSRVLRTHAVESPKQTEKHIWELELQLQPQEITQNGALVHVARLQIGFLLQKEATTARDAIRTSRDELSSLANDRLPRLDGANDDGADELAFPAKNDQSSRRSTADPPHVPGGAFRTPGSRQGLGRGAKKREDGPTTRTSQSIPQKRSGEDAMSGTPGKLPLSTKKQPSKIKDGMRPSQSANDFDVPTSPKRAKTAGRQPPKSKQKADMVKTRSNGAIKGTAKISKSGAPNGGGISKHNVKELDLEPSKADSTQKTNQDANGSSAPLRKQPPRASNGE